MKLICLLTAFLTCSVSWASEAAFNKDRYLASQQSLRSAVEAGEGRFSRLTQGKRNKLLASQDRIFQLLDGKQDISDLDQDARSEFLMKDLAVRQIVASAAPALVQSDPICRREKRTGSHRSEMVCRRPSNADRRDAQDAFWHLSRDRPFDPNY